MTKETALQKRKLELEEELRQRSKQSAAVKMRKDVAKNKLFTIKGQLAKSCVECASLRWFRHDMMSRTQQAKVHMNDALMSVGPN